MSINEKKSFQLYHDLVGVVGVMSDEQAGKLLKAILSYVNAEPPELDDPVVLVAFQPVKQTLDRDHEAYRVKSEQNRENARKRWHASASNGMQSHANGMRKDANHADTDTDTDTDTGKDTDKDTEITTPPKPPQGGKGKRTTLKADWQPTNISLATENNLNPDAALEYFRNWAISGGKMYADWDRVWANACKDWMQGKPGLRQDQPQNPYEQPLEDMAYAEPEGWQDFAFHRYYGSPFLKQLEGEYQNQWDKIPQTAQKLIIEDMTNE